MPDTKTTPDKPGRPVKRQLTDEEQVEILDAYTATNEPVQEITTRFNIHPTHIYNILERAGVTWRRGHPISFETWQARQAKPVDNGVPPETEKALENMLKLPVLPPRPEPVAPTPAVERRVAAPTEWKAKLMFMAEVSGLISLEAESMVEAIELLQLRWPDLRVTSIREA